MLHLPAKICNRLLKLHTISQDTYYNFPYPKKGLRPVSFLLRIIFCIVSSNFFIAKKHDKHYRVLIEEVKSRGNLSTNDENEKIDNATDDRTDHLTVKIPNKSDKKSDNVPRKPSNLVIEIGSTPEETPETHGTLEKDNNGIGHVPEWFDPDLVEARRNERPNVIEQSNSIEQTNEAKNKTKKKKKKKKLPVKCANITSFFKNKASSKENTIAGNTGKKEGNTSNLLLSDEESSIQPSPCLVQDTDEEEEGEVEEEEEEEGEVEKEEEEVPSGNISSILESNSDDDEVDEPQSPFIVGDKGKDRIDSSPLDSVYSSPSMIELDDEEVPISSLAGKRELVAEMLNSTARTAKENRRRCDIFLSLVPPWKKVCSEESLRSRGNLSKTTDKNNTLDKNNTSAEMSNISGLTGTIGKLVDKACESPVDFETDTDDGGGDSEEFQFPSSSIKPMSTKKVQQLKQSGGVGCSINEMIPLPPCHDSFEFE